MNIWHISDTHNFHKKLIVPQNIDLVIHSGDESSSRDSLHNAIECESFIDWFSDLPIKHKIFVAGNHSVAIHRGLISKNFLQKHFIYLENEYVEIEGVKIYGSPFTPTYGKSWAFMRKRGKLAPVWDMIPEDTDILVTHGPPKSKLDLTDCKDTGNLVMAGCAELLNRVMEVRPHYALFGHIHSEKIAQNYGRLRQKGINFINSSCCSFVKGEFNNGHIFKI